MVLAIVEELELQEPRLYEAKSHVDVEGNIVITLGEEKEARDLVGLDADQILLSPPFDLQDTRTDEKVKELDEITSRIRKGDKDAPLELIKALSSGTSD